jgi:hypothetical protein
MSRNSRLVIGGALSLAALTAIAGPAAAGPVTIVNPGFETPALGDGGFTNGSITGWTATGTAARGVLNPTTAQLVAPPEGVQVAYLDGGGTAVTLAQTLATTVVAGESYVLEADFAYRLNLPTTQPPFTLELLAGGSVVASFAGGPGNGFGSGAFKTATASYTAPATGPQIGTALGIRISMIGATNTQITFDDVRINSSPAPSPVPTVGIWLTPVLAWTAWRRIRRAD